MATKRTGGRILVDQLLAHGVELAFCVPGESYLEALIALEETPQIRLVVGRMEAGTANMACAYGQLTGRPGVCLVTRGPGATHASVAVHTARQGSAPMVLLVGQVTRSSRGREALQEIDVESVFGSMAKWAATVEDPARIPEALGRAFATATSGRPGPVVLGLPEDVLAAEAEAEDAGPYRAAQPGPPPGAAEQARELIAGAERPLVVVGGGGWSQGAADAARRLCEAWSLPVTSAFRRQDYIDHESPSYCGTLGLGADPRLAGRARASDVCLVLGARLDEPTTGGYELLRAPALIHVHPDPDELGHVYRPQVAVCSEAGAFAAALGALEPPPAGRRSGWLAGARADHERFRAPADELGAAIAELCAALPEDTILANGAGNYTLWPHRHWRFRRYGTQVGPVSGAMGYGVPAGLAAKLAAPERPVVSFNGDGCFLMCGQELATAVRHRLAVVFVVIDNSSYGTIRMHQRRRRPDSPAAATDLVNPDFAAFARAFGIEGRSVAAGELAQAVQAALGTGRPALVHVPVSADGLTPG